MDFLESMGWKAPVILDGALGTMLQKGGMEPGKSTVTQNVDRPQLVLDVHRKYVEAGVSAICSNTFAGNITALKSAGIDALEVDYNIEGMKLAREAVKGTDVKVAGDIGPTGEFNLQFDHSSIFNVYVRQAEIMMAAPPDFFFVQTMFHLEEALTALEAIKSVSGDIPVAVSLTFNKTRRGFFTMMGDKAVDSLEALGDAGADAVGSNCTLMPYDLLELTKTVRGAVNVPLIIQPNAGQPEIINGEIIYLIDPDDYAEGLTKIVDAGADIVGGCCGSTPEMMLLAREKILLR